MKRRALRSDGKHWYIQRRYGSPAFLERLAQHIERGYLTHDHTSGDVEVYRVEPGAPFYRRLTTPTEESMRELLSDAVDDAAGEQWDSLYACICELTSLLKAAGVEKEKWLAMLSMIEQRAQQRTGDFSLPGRMRAAMEARARTERPVIVLH